MKHPRQLGLVWHASSSQRPSFRLHQRDQLVCQGITIVVVQFNGLSECQVSRNGDFQGRVGRQNLDNGKFFQCTQAI